ncbi:MAG: hypothetical protein JXR56_04070, partial [Candidatus Cloacimonetes bacterium]|nr:hypothetical protein [Candidatus Cloacimonadota bacterium]
IGNFYRNRTPKYFVSAMEELVNDKLLPDNVIINFVGNYFKEAKSVLEDNLIINQLVIKPQVEHHEAIKQMQESDGLLLFIATPNGKGVLTGKLFEYLRVCKPILAMIPEDGEAAGILKEHGHHNICKMEDIEGIKKTFVRFLSEISEKSAEYRIPYGYTRNEQAQLLMDRLSRREN